jgi:hypothetical protein
MIGPRERNIHDVLYDFREESWSDNLARFDRWMDQNSYQPDAFDFATAGMGMGPKLGTNLLRRLLGSRWAARLLPAAANGTRITGFTRHGLNRAIGDGAKRAGTKGSSILDALKNPKSIKSGVDEFGRPFQTFKGSSARVVVNPETGQIVSVNPLGRAGVR